jgi:predicted enzyme related to lactoylglutathione lyase
MTYYTLDAPAGQDDPAQVSAGGAMQQMQAERDLGTPSAWCVYFNVDDVDATFAQALALGATAVMEPHDIPGIGRSSWLADPQGAVFAAMTPLPRT